MPIEFDDDRVPKLARRHPDGTTLREIYEGTKDLASSVPKGQRLEWLVEGVWMSVMWSLIDVEKLSRCPTKQPQPLEKFISEVIGLRFCLDALEDQFGIGPQLLLWCSGHDWPQTPPVVFGRWSSASALELIYEFGGAWYRACMECESIIDQERLDIPWDRQLEFSMAVRWQSDALWEIKYSLLPPENDLSYWQVVREWTIVRAKFDDELRRSKTLPDASGGSAADEDYRSGQWLSANTNIPASRLRHATSPKRKTKHVRSKMIDGVVHYSVSDVERWWSGDMPDAVKMRA